MVYSGAGCRVDRLLLLNIVSSSQQPCGFTNASMAIACISGNFLALQVCLDFNGYIEAPRECGRRSVKAVRGAGHHDVRALYASCPCGHGAWHLLDCALPA